MANSKLSDGDAKNILRKWPTRSDTLWESPIGKGYWLQAQPKPANSGITSPTLRTPGSSLFKTQPDGMYAFLNEDVYADVVCIEVCGTQQNLNDKRSRYAADVRSMVLHCPEKWMLKDVTVQNGGVLPRWQACGTIATQPAEDLIVPVRYLRVLFAIPNDLYKTWSAENIPDGHEFYCRHSSLSTYNSPATQEFLRGMEIQRHFRTDMGR